VTLALFFLLITYDLGFSFHRARAQESVSVESQISAREQEHLASGGRAIVVKAPVKINQELITVRGYGPAAEAAQVGQPVTIVIPKQHTSAATLQGYWPRPTTAGLLLQFALWFYAPAALAIACSLVSARREQKRVVYGAECPGKQIKALPLPRPLSDHVLAKWSYLAPDESEKTFWTLQRKEEDSVVVSDPAGASLFNNLLPQWQVENETLISPTLTRKILAGATLFTILLQGLIAACYLLT